MPFKDIFKSPSKEEKRKSPPPRPVDITFVRSDTYSQDVIHPPSGFKDELPPTPQAQSHLHRRFSATSKLRETFHRQIKPKTPPASFHVPQDLPDIPDSTADREAAWEKRATLLVGGSGSSGPVARGRSDSVASQVDDENIQEAIRLHEASQYERSTAMFGRLADPNGPNNPLSQVLYGLALRHGWGIEKDPAKAVEYLQAAAKNSAAVEKEALKAGMTKGGSAKGELVLAIYELGNSFRHGWGVEKDPAAAREYYETAANLGDADAQNEVAWCYVEGFGIKKNKKKAAKFYRMAEKQGNKTLGNSWIYKDKYMDED